MLESNVTPNILKSSDSFITFPPIVNGGDWGCIACDLETIIVLLTLIDVCSLVWTVVVPTWLRANGRTIRYITTDEPGKVMPQLSWVNYHKTK